MKWMADLYWRWIDWRAERITRRQKKAIAKGKFFEASLPSRNGDIKIWLSAGPPRS